MADRISKAARSALMSRVGQKNTKPELIVRRALHSMGYRFRLHKKNLPGKPDITLPKLKTVIFVHGCFWHGHDCRKGKLPTTRIEFWKEKILKNRERDRAVAQQLIDMGYHVIVVWECETHDANRLNEILSETLRPW